MVSVSVYDPCEERAGYILNFVKKHGKQLNFFPKKRLTKAFPFTDFERDAELKNSSVSVVKKSSASRFELL